MKKTAIRILALALALASVFTACSAKPASSTPAAEAQPPVSTAADGSYTLPLTKEPVTITIATYDNFEASASYTAGLLPIFEELQNRTGIQLEIEAYNSSDYTEIMQTRLAGGTDLPDIILVPGSDPVKYASAGLLLPLNDLIEKYAPNIKKMYEEYPSYRSAVLTPDGEQYTLATVIESAPMNMPTLVVRKDWLDKAGLPIPKTIDEWTAAFEAFKTMDMNGNGKNDEIPFCGIDSPFYSLDFFMSAYGLDIKDDITWEYLGVTLDDSGKIVSDWYNPNAKEFLKQMNSWYNAGYFDKEMLTIDGDKWNAKILTNQVGCVGPYALSAPQWTKQMQAEYPEAEWVPAPYPSTQYSEGFVRVGNGLQNSITYAITKDCKNPELVMQFLDYIYANPEGNSLMTWGLEGEDYVEVGGKKQYSDAILSADNPGTAIWARGMCPNLPYVAHSDLLESRISEYPEYIATMKEISAQTEEALVFAMRTQEESDKMASIRPNLRTYMSEMIPKFITGVEPIDNYDAFTQKLTEMGMEDFLALKQTLYTRANG